MSKIEDFAEKIGYFMGVAKKYLPLVVVILVTLIVLLLVAHN